MENLRAEPRFIANQPVTIHVLGSDNGVETLGTIVDFSATGMGLESNADLEGGAQVEIRWDRGTVVGQVRYCHESSGKFRAGIKIATVIAVEGQVPEQGAA